MSASRAVYAVWVFLVLLAVPSEAGQGLLPYNPHIPGFQVNRIVQGKEAISEINRLHGMDIDVAAAVIVHYSGKGASQATVWASEALSREQAQQQIDVMIEKMKKSAKSPFSGYRTWEVRTNSIIGFDGLGQAHRVFRIGRWVYWLSGQEQNTDVIMMHICTSP